MFNLKNKYPKLKDSKSIDLEKPEKLIQAFCKQEKMTCFSMLSYFREYIKKNPAARTYYKYDGHWNDIGTRLAVEFLAQNLKGFIEN